MNPIWRYFTKKPRVLPPPRHLISEYDITKADRQQRLGLMSGRVRSPGAYDALSARHQTKTAMELIEKLPPPKPRTFSQRLKALVWRWAGQDRRKNFMTTPTTLRVRYRYRDRRSP
jgi:hypothetical protein